VTPVTNRTLIADHNLVVELLPMAKAIKVMADALRMLASGET
jgi:hypothetical protein